MGRENLLCAFVLIDSRHPPQRVDLEFVEWLVAGEVPFTLVFTKTDKNKRSLLEKNITLFREAMREWSDGEPRAFFTSTKTGEGRREILSFIDEILQIG